MKKSIFYPIFAFLALFVSLDGAFAQAVISRTEFICYDKRNDAKSDIRTNNDKYIDLRPTLQFEGEGSVRAVYEQEIVVPASWNDYNAYLHTENIGGDYTIFVNGAQITEAIDRFTPTETYISSYLDQGKNIVAIVIVDEPYMEAVAEGMTMPKRTQFENCYIFAQRRLGVYDFNVRLVPDSLEHFAQLKLDVLVDNSFSSDEVIEVGYDIYAPDGKLMEYSVNDLALEKFTRDTLSFKPYIYHSNPNRWTAANPKLYDLTLYVKRSGILWEYIPLKVGFAEYGYTEGGDITAFGKPLTLKKETYNAAADKATTEREIKALKQRGINCLTPDYPQPRWFYDICDKVGIYVIDCAAVTSPSMADNRALGGTPANAPELVDEYLRRVETMYHRAQNHVCIIAFSLGKKAGNGYNLYKAYELLKSKGDSRAIIYEDADGEWNTDVIE
ncbi:MAG: hypothetical protein IKY89_07455 [Alistipes sp.]|nr:hypothetical protein [Alistipes sp.]